MAAAGELAVPRSAVPDGTHAVHVAQEPADAEGVAQRAALQLDVRPSRLYPAWLEEARSPGGATRLSSGTYLRTGASSSTRPSATRRINAVAV